jgi:hypothetical protein
MLWQITNKSFVSNKNETLVLKLNSTSIWMNENEEVAKTKVDQDPHCLLNIYWEYVAGVLNAEPEMQNFIISSDVQLTNGDGAK